MNPETLKALASRIEAGEIGPEIDALIVSAFDGSGVSRVTIDETEAFVFKKAFLPAWRLEFLQERRLNVGSQWSVSLVFQDVQAVARSTCAAAAITAAVLRALALENTQ